MNRNFSFSTDTATLTIFDLSSLSHRISDTSDWWSIPEDEMDEINKGNVVFLNLGSDGNYLVEIHDDIPDDFGSLNLNIPSGKVFIGAGEDTSGGGLEPNGSDYISGEFINLSPGVYQVKFKRECSIIALAFIKSSVCTNNIETLIRL